ncbi:hypothetical protein VFPFJ_06899 [Purpureocillium lilacinum]|uniref:Uncharacterized protein n=1 Tax=Purpureocillium lilacinum TaxID=33203 RepID=A0A179GQX8_PURLI|nr:hypothetical protein VFPFJ_06899 [Purpureocillium lilacinum]OAQ80162.1 hypothetical protein VFPBJ_05747 [Purpureocillium lilacinum]OAQ88434.1 hypothetical protein VFPFJ_06899 [Purpureocillium lilacinum]
MGSHSHPSAQGAMAPVSLWHGWLAAAQLFTAWAASLPRQRGKADRPGGRGARSCARELARARSAERPGARCPCARALPPLARCRLITFVSLPSHLQHLTLERNVDKHPACAGKKHERDEAARFGIFALSSFAYESQSFGSFAVAPAS